MSPDPVWVDGSTPLNAINMTKLQTRDERAIPSGYAPLDSGGKVPVANLPDLSGTYQSLAQKAAANGYASLDSGTKVPITQIPDLSGVYQTLTGKNAASGYVGLSASSQIVFQGDAAANLYRLGAGSLKTDGVFSAGGLIQASNAGAAYANIGAVGPAGQSGVSFQSDANLYRSGPGALMTDAGFTVGGSLATRSGYLYFGAAADTTLFRAAASTLQTNGVLVISPDGTTPVGATAGSLTLGDKQGTNFPGTISGGGVLFVSGGGLFFRSSGNIVQLA